MTDKEGKADSQPFHLILLAHGLARATRTCAGSITDAHLDGYYYKPRIDHDTSPSTARA